MASDDERPDMRVFFYRTKSGTEPVRAWLKELPNSDRRVIGFDLDRIQSEWPVGMPLCRSLGGRLWELRSALPSGRISRLIFFIESDEIYIVHGFIKKTQKTPLADLALAIRRLKEAKK